MFFQVKQSVKITASFELSKTFFLKNWERATTTVFITQKQTIGFILKKVNSV